MRPALFLILAISLLAPFVMSCGGGGANSTRLVTIEPLPTSTPARLSDSIRSGLPA